MIGIILKNYLFSMLGHNFHEDVILQTRKIVLRLHVLFVYWKKHFTGKDNFLPFENVQNINNIS